eukprot:scaffold7442_cov258-Pinguiococcus_pyrenoidosus.AAC.4
MGNRSSADSGSEGRPSDADSSVLDPDEEPQLPPEQMSYWQMAKQGYQELVNAIVRPPRANYEREHLGPDQFMFCGREFMRSDFPVLNNRGQTLRCSFWEPLERRGDANGALPCVIYMHGNSSARPECLPQLGLVLGMGCTMLAFDFAGSGQSDGEYVSLGVYEKDDLAAVIAWLRESGRVSTIALWGRSMGAATALMHGGQDPSIAAMILDSPFSNLQDIADDMLARGREQGVRIPQFIVAIALRMLRSTVQRTANFNIRDCSPINYIESCFIPALFCAGRGDDFITPSHSQRLHDAYPGDKNIILVDGDHNSPRPKFMFDSAGIFLQRYLQVPRDWALDGYERYCNVPPWVSINDTYGLGYGEYNVYERLGLDPHEVELLYTGGMSDERQAEIQANLMHMFGTDVGDASSSDGPSQRSSQDAAPKTQGTVATTLTELQNSSARRLRNMTQALDVDTSGCIEKGDYIDALLGSGRVVLLDEDDQSQEEDEATGAVQGVPVTPPPD